MTRIRALEILHFRQHRAQMFGMQPLLAPGAVRHLGGHLQAGFIQTGIHFAFPRLAQEARVNRHAGGNQRAVNVRKENNKFVSADTE